MQNQKILASNTAAVLDMKAERLQPKTSKKDDVRFQDHVDNNARKEAAEARADQRSEKIPPKPAESSSNDLPSPKKPNRGELQEPSQRTDKTEYVCDRAGNKTNSTHTVCDKGKDKPLEAVAEETESNTADLPQQQTGLEAKPEMLPQEAVLSEASIEGQQILEEVPPLAILADEAVAEAPLSAQPQASLANLPQVDISALETIENAKPTTDLNPLTQSADILQEQLVVKQESVASAATASATNITAAKNNSALVADVLAQTQSLETSDVLQKALNGQVTTESERGNLFSAEVRNALQSAFKSADITGKAADAPGLNPADKLRLDQTGAVLAENTENAPLDQSAIEAELVEAELTTPKAKPAAEKTDTPVRAPLAAETLANLAKAGVDTKAPSGSAPSEIGALQKTAAASQNMTSAAGKPEFAQMAQRSSQPIPVQTVGMHIARQASQGNTKFEIRLDPPELGRVDVKLEIGDDGRMRAHLTVEKSETLDMLQRDQRVLERAMQQNGMKGFEDVSFSLKDQSQGQGGERQQNAQQQNNGSQSGNNNLAGEEMSQKLDTIQFSRAQARRAMGGVDVTL